MIYVNGIPGRTAKAGARSFLFFTGFAYLGMPSLPYFQEKLYEGIRACGAVFPSSRVSNSRNALYETFEEALSEYVGQEASACFSSGYLAALAAVQFAAGKGGRLFYMRGAHPSLREVSNIGAVELEGTKDMILDRIRSSSSDYPTIILESVDPLSGKVADLDWLLNIKKHVRVIIDDSHGVGLLGQNGEGISGRLPKADHLRYLVCYSLSKAFSCEGGAVSGDAACIDQIKSRPPFSATTPMSPAFAYAWMECRPFFKEQRRKLQENCRYFSQKTADFRELDYDIRLPVARLPFEGLYEKALKDHILLSAFRYPTDNDPLLTRAVLNALHTREDIDRLVRCISQA